MTGNEEMAKALARYKNTQYMCVRGKGKARLNEKRGEVSCNKAR